MLIADSGAFEPLIGSNQCTGKIRRVSRNSFAIRYKQVLVIRMNEIVNSATKAAAFPYTPGAVTRVVCRPVA